MRIEDGSGQGNQAKVDINKRLHAAAITEGESDLAASTGDKFNLNTGDMTLTNASESALFYIKNDETKDFVITTLIYNIGGSTGGSGDYLVDVYSGVSGGTVISDASDVEMNANFNFGSSKTLAADAYKGGQGKTLTGGTKAVSSRLTSGGRVVVSLGALHIPKGATLGIKMTPQSGNTSQVVQIIAVGYIKSEAVDAS